MAGAAVKFLVGAHASLTGASVLSGALRSAPIDHSQTSRLRNDFINPPMPVPPGIIVQATRVARRIYTGGGIDPAVVSPGVVFEDPVACCVGTWEVCEGFRALGSCAPESIWPAEIVHARADSGGSGDGGSNTVVFHLRQRYFGWLNVESALLVSTNSSGMITRIEERWNGSELLGHHVDRSGSKSCTSPNGDGSESSCDGISPAQLLQLSQLSQLSQQLWHAWTITGFIRTGAGCVHTLVKLSRRLNGFLTCAITSWLLW